MSIGARKPSQSPAMTLCPSRISRGAKSAGRRLPHLHRRQEAGPPGDLRPDQRSRLRHRRRRPPHPRQSRRQGHRHQLRRPRVPLSARACTSRSSPPPWSATKTRCASSTRTFRSPRSIPGPCTPRSTPTAWPRKAAMFTGPTWIISTPTARRSPAPTAICQELCCPRPHRPPGSHDWQARLTPSSTPASPSRIETEVNELAQGSLGARPRRRPGPVCQWRAHQRRRT